MKVVDSGVFAANALDAIEQTASFDMSTGSPGFADDSCMAMLGAYGWALPQNGLGVAAAWKFNMWGHGNASSGNPAAPIPFLQFRDLPGQSGVLLPLTEGLEYTIVNADTQAAFAGAISATGGTNHYKVRVNTALTGWTRIG